MSDHILRVIGVAVQAVTLLAFVFYAGATYQRLNFLESEFFSHRVLAEHKGASVRLATLELQVTRLTQTVDRFARAVGFERARQLEE